MFRVKAKYRKSEQPYFVVGLWLGIRAEIRVKAAFFGRDLVRVKAKIQKKNNPFCYEL